MTGFWKRCRHTPLFVLGIVSLVSLSLLSYERYKAVLHSSKVDLSDFRKAWFSIGGAWLYSLLWTLPPLLGWSSYGPEGPGTTCSVQWHLRSPASISYVLCLFIFCLLLPLLLMVYSYCRILVAIRRVSSSTVKRRRVAFVFVTQMSNKPVTVYPAWFAYTLTKQEKNTNFKVFTINNH